MHCYDHNMEQAIGTVDLDMHIMSKQATVQLVTFAAIFSFQLLKQKH